MASTYLTVSKITRRSLDILHQASTFCTSIDRQHDGSFEMSPKGGGTLRIREPNEYTVTTGATLSAQETTESSVSLVVGTQKHVGIYFLASDLMLSIDDFADRFLDPAISVLAANVEGPLLQDLTLDVPNLVDNDGNALTFKNILDGGAVMSNNLAPMDRNRHALLSTGHTATIVDSLKGLFNSQSAVSNQYRTGQMGETGGFMFAQSTHVSNHTTGTAAEGDTLYNINGANQTGSTITVGTGTTTFKAGDIITLAGMNSVHPETKVSTGVAKQFVVTADAGATATTLSIYPSIVTSGAKQNCSGSPTNAGAVTKVGAGNGELLNGSLLYHRDAFTVAFADLPVPGGVDFARVERFDNMSLRILRDYDINNDRFPCRADVFYGGLAQRPIWACRVHADG